MDVLSWYIIGCILTVLGYDNINNNILGWIYLVVGVIYLVFATKDLCIRIKNKINNI